MADRAEQMTLDDNLEVDSKATANNVRNFLTFKFEHFQNYAGLNVSDLSVVDDSHLSSPKMDASGVSSHGGINHTESSFNRIMEAEQACKAIYKSIKNCRNNSRQPYQDILTKAYLENEDDYKIQSELGYGESQYFIKKRQALCEFADRFEKWKRECDIAYFDDLHVPKKRKSELNRRIGGVQAE